MYTHTADVRLDKRITKIEHEIEKIKIVLEKVIDYLELEEQEDAIIDGKITKNHI